MTSTSSGAMRLFRSPHSDGLLVIAESSAV